MRIITHVTPWGECRRYFDECGELLYSEYLAAPRPLRRMEPGAPSLRHVRAVHRNGRSALCIRGCVR